jgi:putative endonuclease
VKTLKRKFGDLGESVAASFLEKRGFEIVARNYLKPWGEIDIVAKSSGVVHFIEVKSVKKDLVNISHETDGYRAEDNVHEAKLKRLSKTIQTYLLESGEEDEWVFDVVVVLIDTVNKKAKVRFLEDMVL